MRYDLSTLKAFAAALLGAAGLDGDRPAVVAERLVAADAMGHTTHGLAQLGDCLKEIEAGRMAKIGEPTIVSDRGAVAVWDAGRLPGVWVTALVVTTAVERALP